MNWLKSQLNVDWMVRFKNYGFVISVVSAIILVLTQFGITVDNAYIMGCVKAVLSLLVLLGLVNNPTTETKGFGDDKALEPKA